MFSGKIGGDADLSYDYSEDYNAYGSNYDDNSDSYDDYGDSNNLSHPRLTIESSKYFQSGIPVPKMTETWKLRVRKR